MGRVILVIYGWGFGIAAIVENFMYLQDEGFMAWLLFGEIVATFRAVIWPLNVYQALVG